MKYDYDIGVIGGGLAGLSLLYHLIEAGRLEGKRVLLVDAEGRKSAHDRTWSFWEVGEGPFEHLVYKRWQEVTLHNSKQNLACPLGAYTYKLIRSTEFYGFVNERIDAAGNVERLRARAEDVRPTDAGVSFVAGGRAIRVRHAFSSVPLHLRPRQIKQPYLDQHFRGWYIRTPHKAFEPNRAALMDFRTPQQGETRFFYVLPFSPTYAMVELAIFSNNHLRQEEYDALISEYLQRVWGLDEYEIEHREQGNIPMTTYPFARRDGNLIYIGLRGGAARPSTGYTFYGLQRQLSKLAHNFPTVPAVWRKRDLLYDATILRILQDGQLPGDEVFLDLFSRNPIERVLEFLNGETSFVSELALMSTTDIKKFGKSFLQATFT